MRTIRLYHPQSVQSNSEVLLEDTAFHHAVHVLRCKRGDQLELFDGNGQQAQAVLASVERRKALVQIQSVTNQDRESPLHTLLIQAISKGERMDYCLQKATELGVSEVQPVFSERSNVHLDSKRWEKRHDHWNKVIIGACEQSGRNHLPQLHVPVALEQAIESAHHYQGIFLLHPENSIPFSQAKPQNGHIGFIVGSEGGFSEQEVKRVKDAGIQSLHLGKRILRSETTGVVAIAIAQSRWGDLA